ncbi:MAG TPA: polysaccharide deacetylase family protein [Solirubrobacteraceae bacterium]|jgi:peptidoglycan/xylan/chitin deacetylase (PgdA/CDA1 family)
MDNEASLARREQRRRAIRRRRTAALIALAGALLAVVAVLAAGALGGSTAPRRAGASTTAASSRHHARTHTSAGGSSAVRSTGRPGTQAVPILMYHVIAPPPAGAPFPGLYVSPSEFAAQMQALKAAGWHAVTLDQLQSYWREGTPLGAGRPIVLTFDNGYESQYTQALPVLQRLGWVADENIQLSGLPPSQGGLGQAEIRRLVAAGWELDTQGFSHADLIRLGAEQLHYEVAVARSALQQRYHVPVNWFCYPSGHYDATVIDTVRAAGYRGSTTVVPGWAHPTDDPYRLHRLRVLGGTSPQALLSLVTDTRSAPAAPSSYSGA